MPPEFFQTGPTRSQLIAEALKQNRRQQVPQQVFSVGEGFARAGSQIVDAFSAKRQIDKQLEERTEQQSAAQTVMAEALAAGKVAGPGRETAAIANVLIGSDIPELAQRGFQLQIQNTQGRQEQERLEEVERAKAINTAKLKKIRPATREEKEAFGLPANLPASIDANGDIKLINVRAPDAPIQALDKEGNLTFVTRQEALSGNFTPVPQAGQTISVTSPDGQVLQITSGIGGNSPLERATKNTIEGDLLNGEGALARLDSIAMEFDRDALTFFGKAEGAALRFADKLGVDLDTAQKTALASRRRFTNAVEQNFNIYRKNITGAAAAIKELEVLRASFLSSDLSPTEFVAEFDRYQGEIKRSQRLLRRIRREGLGGKSQGQRIDELFTGGEDDNIEQRGEEVQTALQSQGLTGDVLNQAVADQLIAEGYVDRRFR